MMLPGFFIADKIVSNVFVLNEFKSKQSDIARREYMAIYT